MDNKGIIHKEKINSGSKYIPESDRKKHNKQNSPAVECKDLIFNDSETIGYSSYQTFDSYFKYIGKFNLFYMIAPVAYVF